MFSILSVSNTLYNNIHSQTDPVRQAEELSIATREADSFHRLDFTISSLIMDQVATSGEIRANREVS